MGCSNTKAIPNQLEIATAVIDSSKEVAEKLINSSPIKEMDEGEKLMHQAQEIIDYMRKNAGYGESETEKSASVLETVLSGNNTKETESTAKTDEPVPEDSEDGKSEAEESTPIVPDQNSTEITPSADGNSAEVSSSENESKEPITEKTTVNSPEDQPAEELDNSDE